MFEKNKHLPFLRELCCKLYRIFGLVCFSIYRMIFYRYFVNRLQYNGQTICDLYWPEKLNIPEHYKSNGFEISVTLLETNQSDCFIKRIFSISMVSF